MAVTDQALPIHCSASKSNYKGELSITAFCVRMYTAGWRLSSFNLSCNLYGIIPVVGRSCGIIGPFSVAIFFLAFLAGLRNSGASR